MSVILGIELLELEIERLRATIKTEREACARVADQVLVDERAKDCSDFNQFDFYSRGWSAASREIARLIRAEGKDCVRVPEPRNLAKKENTDGIQTV